MPRSRSRLTRLVLALVLLAGCASATTQTGLASAGQALIAVGTQFVAVGDLYTQHCTPTITLTQIEGFCSGFKTFAPKFQQAYPLAVRTWKAAVTVRNLVQAQEAESTILDLGTELVALAGQLYAAIGGR